MEFYNVNQAANKYNEKKVLLYEAHAFTHVSVKAEKIVEW